MWISGRAAVVLPAMVCCLFSEVLSAGSAARSHAGGEAGCVSRALSISREKSEIDRFFYDRVVRAGGEKENLAVCLAYSVWDDFLNKAAGELERCAEYLDAEGYYLESAEIGGAMAKLGCRQGSVSRQENTEESADRGLASLR